MIAKSFLTVIAVSALLTDMCNAKRYDRYDDEDYYYEDYDYRGRNDDYYDRKGGRNNKNLPQCLEARGGSESKELRVPRRIVERSNAIEVTALTNALCCLHVGVKTSGGSGRITYIGSGTPPGNNNNRRNNNNRQTFENLNTFEEAYIMVLKEICNEKSYYYEGESVGERVCHEQEECIEEAIMDTTLWHGSARNNPYMPDAAGPAPSIFAWSTFSSILAFGFYFVL